MLVRVTGSAGPQVFLCKMSVLVLPSWAYWEERGGGLLQQWCGPVAAADSPQWLPVSLLEAAGFEQGESSKLRFSLIGVS